MAFRSTAEEMERLQLSDEDTEDLWDSPSKRGTKKQNRTPPVEESTTPPPKTSHDSGTLFDRQEAREAALQNELRSVRHINEVIEGLLGSLDCAKGNMDTVSRTVDSASTLLNTWTRILSQTEHNQRLILNPNWQGAVQDAADMESEELVRQQAAERRERELQQQREAVARRAQEEERRRAQGSTARGTRGTTRGRVPSTLGRTPSVSYKAPGASRTTTSSTTRGSTTTTRRPVSGIARGSGVTRAHRSASVADLQPPRQLRVKCCIFALRATPTTRNELRPLPGRSPPNVRSPRGSPPVPGVASPGHFAPPGPIATSGLGNTGFGNDVESGRWNMGAFETSLPIRMDYEAMLAYLLLPPAGGVFLLLVEHKSDYVRSHIRSTSIIANYGQIIHLLFSWSSFFSWLFFLCDIALIGFLSMRAYRDVDTLEHFEVPIFGRLANNFVDDE
ncbi:DASH complex subunit Duo1-domain-containing protein [Aspergillus candidus]|uniref:DASH complex subunit DUO1 n=1 Tax=Aspergillus candidus TaxID=41067 RepID=A0A2I2EZ76_ASPCN|nr:DASH complex subunit Duo1-domain-containing protein [Aspergillus candidus]PLB33685.1 DASH complex subunit Duo1-domain-containing protein [Aspergillus candidus]